jgi:hypothetical protein
LGGSAVYVQVARADALRSQVIAVPSVFPRPFLLGRCFTHAFLNSRTIRGQDENSDGVLTLNFSLIHFELFS